MKPRALVLDCVLFSEFLGRSPMMPWSWTGRALSGLRAHNPSGGAPELFDRFFCGWFRWRALAPLPLSLCSVRFEPNRGCEVAPSLYVPAGGCWPRLPLVPMFHVKRACPRIRHK